jgi:putative ABC transport system permease protein
MTSAGDSLRQAGRALWRRPLATAVAVGTLAVGIAASTATFVMVHAAFVAPLPFAEPDRLVSPQVISNRGFPISLSLPNERDLSRRNRVFERSGSSTGWRAVLTGAGPARVLQVREVYGDFFATLGFKARYGRLLSAAETERGVPPRVVLGDSFFHQLGGSPGLLGSPLLLDKRPYVIVGVLPPGVGYPSSDVPAYLPLGALGDDLSWEDRESSFGLRLIGRLRPSVTLAAAARDLARVTREIDAAEGHPVITLRLDSLSEVLVGDLRRPLFLLLAAGALVVALATLNAGSLLMARAETRRAEIAVRRALGAPRGEVLRLLLGESVWLALLGGALGLLAAAGLLGALGHRFGSDLPRFVAERLRIGGPAVAFGAGLGALLAVVVGALPALALGFRRADPLQGQRASASRRAGRLRSSLVVGELALGVVLLVTAGLLLSSLARLRAVDKGFDPVGVAVARLAVPDGHFQNKASWLAFHRRLLAAAEHHPGVRSASLSLLIPLSDRSWEMALFVAGMPIEPHSGDSVLFNVVTPSYFSTLRVPIVEGRAFTAADRDGGQPVAIVDETLARRYWPGHSPLGQRIAIDFDMSRPQHAAGLGKPLWRTIVGVTRNVRHYELQSPSRIQVYLPLEQTFDNWSFNVELALRGERQAESLLPALPRLVGRIDPEVPVSDVRELGSSVDHALLHPVLISTVVTALGALALLLAAVGVFALASFSVTQRRHELAIRQAIGATPASLLRAVLARGLAWCAWGALVGLGGAVGAAELTKSLLFGVGAFDPLTYGSALALLASMVLAACLLPALRAMRVDPARALREEPAA